ncbi:hypothetical protein N7499_005837 [Penicillium canescens]|nr:hypothetical protein N7444_003985 [Penicillium canescens]KAJ6080963.1 hypothetical protein N7499_005837 [Penicillium canescens]KAJ6177241.1 hypothetical protein N7485_004155 [Penicillium canescens]
MARTAQTARRDDEGPEWHQRRYLDHKGNHVYTKVPIQPKNYDSIVTYLFGITELGPFLEIYISTQRNAFIAYRKRLREAFDKQSNCSNCRPPLIAKDSATISLVHRREDGNELRTIPLAIDFSRRFPTKVRTVELEYRVPNIYGDIADFVKFGKEVVSEAIEMKRSVRSYITPNGEWKIDYDTDDSQEVKEILEQQPTPNHESKDLCLTWGSDKRTLTGTNFINSKESDLQYVIHIPFLADNADNLLERTAHIFTTHLLAKIGSARIRLEFRIPGLRLASVWSSPHPNDLPVGVLYNTKNGSKQERQERLVPLQPSNVGIVPNYTCKQFAFGPSGCETIIRRSAGMTEAGRRLAMLDLKKEVGWDDVRYLTADEYRCIFGISLEQYQIALLELEPFEPYQPQEV